MHIIPIRTPSASYNVYLGAGLLGSVRTHLEDAFPGPARRCFVVTSPEIWRLWGERFRASFPPSGPCVLFVPPGEQHKRLATLERLAEELAQHGADRASVLLALGGGVIGDVAGFLAAIYMRGLAYVQIPTTLLAQVDSSVGGKTGVNLEAGKNLIGAFHHPRRVLADTEALSTLPDSELRAGLFECLKAGLIRDPELLGFMRERRDAILARDPSALAHVIAASIRIKAAVVGEDERESGVRMILNFGHTVGHALEAVTGYTALLHGEAVGWGMLVALEISRSRGMLNASDAASAATLLRDYGLPALPPLDAAALLRATGADKKNREGRRRFIVLRALGDACVVDDVADAELLSAIGAALATGAVAP